MLKCNFKIREGQTGDSLQKLMMGHVKESKWKFLQQTAENPGFLIVFILLLSNEVFNFSTCAIIPVLLLWSIHTVCYFLVMKQFDCAQPTADRVIVTK